MILLGDRDNGQPWTSQLQWVRTETSTCSLRARRFNAIAYNLTVIGVHSFVVMHHWITLLQNGSHVSTVSSRKTSRNVAYTVLFLDLLRVTPPLIIAYFCFKHPINNRLLSAVLVSCCPHLLLNVCLPDLWLSPSCVAVWYSLERLFGNAAVAPS